LQCKVTRSCVLKRREPEGINTETLCNLTSTWVGFEFVFGASLVPAGCPFAYYYTSRFTLFSNMRSSLLFAAALPLVQGIRIVQSNDDGWSEANLRTFFDVLNTAGHEVVLSGPAENQSGTG
jgi:hypothetical protein